jgi:hypothetical protein
MLSRYFARMREIVVPHGGTVEKFIGDAVARCSACRQRMRTTRPGGVGKSRLVEEFIAEVDMRVVRGSCLSHGEGITYLLDLWKCHICRQADHLFLVVPMLDVRTSGPERVYPRVVARLSTFFAPGNEINVCSAAIFGYA